MILSAHQITKTYGTNTVLFPIDLGVEAGEKLGIIGETGSGKTTLLRSLAGLVDLDQGTVLYENQRIAGPSEKLIPGHSALAYLSQSIELRNQYRVRDLLELHSVQQMSADLELAKWCRIDHLMDRMTDQLSGGEKQRIGLAIALAKHPNVLMLDEPFSNLDIGHRNTLRAILDDLHQQLNLTLLIVSHNPTEILGWADRILVMRAGHCIQTGSPQEIYHHPKDEYVAQLLGPFNFIRFPGSDHHEYIRPELLCIQTDGIGLWSGEIFKKEFEGPTTLYSIRTEIGTLLIRSREDRFIPGQKINISRK